MKLNQVTIHVKDLENSIIFYKKLGLQLIVKSEFYARFIVPGNEATFSLHVSDELNMNGSIIFFECDQLDEKVQELKLTGTCFTAEPEDKPWLWREAHLDDPDNNHLCLYHAGTNRLNPPWRLKD